ncbi:MAG: hypothetical protein U0Y68_24360 [Blastocatellia bacterium]
METISNFPYFEVEFNKQGAVHNDAQVQELLDFLAAGTVTDLLVMSHGWNNDMDEARRLYRQFFAHLRIELTNNCPPDLGPRAFAVCGILWPSKKFADDDLIASGAASLGDLPDEDAEIRQQLDALKAVFADPAAETVLEQARSLVPLLETDLNAAHTFTDLIRSLPNLQALHSEDAADLFFTLSATTLLDLLGRPRLPLPAVATAGGAASFDPTIGLGGTGGALDFDLFGGITAAIRNVLNYTTYYQMKERAGIVGQRGVYQVLQTIRAQHPGIKIHLIGHSFGGRLVTSVAKGPAGQPPVGVSSLTLLQAAFSQNGFAENFDGDRKGFFREVVAAHRVAGPILITHSINDRAVGRAYPIAAMLSGDDAAAFGDSENRFGGIGRNGAQFTPEADNSTPLGATTAVYSFSAGTLYNLNADAIITGHSDVAKGEIAHALLAAIATT